MELPDENLDFCIQIEDESGQAFEARLESGDQEQGVVYLNIKELEQFNDSQIEECPESPDLSAEEVFLDHNDYIVDNIKVEKENEEDSYPASDEMNGSLDDEYQFEERRLIQAVAASLAKEILFSSSSTSSEDEDFKMLRLLYLKKRKKLVKRRKKTKKP